MDGLCVTVVTLGRGVRHSAVRSVRRVVVGQIIDSIVVLAVTRRRHPAWAHPEIGRRSVRRPRISVGIGASEQVWIMIYRLDHPVRCLQSPHPTITDTKQKPQKEKRATHAQPQVSAPSSWFKLLLPLPAGSVTARLTHAVGHVWLFFPFGVFVLYLLLWGGGFAGTGRGDPAEIS